MLAGYRRGQNVDMESLLVFGEIGVACLAVLPIVLTKSGMTDTVALRFSGAVFALYLLVAFPLSHQFRCPFDR